jgi:hypothetical protein
LAPGVLLPSPHRSCSHERRSKEGDASRNGLTRRLRRVGNRAGWLHGQVTSRRSRFEVAREVPLCNRRSRLGGTCGSTRFDIPPSDLRVGRPGTSGETSTSANLATTLRLGGRDRKSRHVVSFRSLRRRDATTRPPPHTLVGAFGQDRSGRLLRGASERRGAVLLRG